ncbi:MAG TPA: hypothetical protein VEJ47_16930 [Candidatus Eremiobacteraceae bacterium]|nr:hypothetical protein [Candidatus Eremiobacteraceae bacterium]
MPQQDAQTLAVEGLPSLPAQQFIAAALSSVPFLQQDMDLPWQQAMVEPLLSPACALAFWQQQPAHLSADCEEFADAAGA